jgi:hypothetical protein
MKSIHVATLPVIWLLSTGIIVSEDLKVADGQSREIKVQEQYMVLHNFTLGNNARITFAPGVDHWDVWAEEAIFGENSTIGGPASTGAAGGNGKNGRSTNSPGHYGERGGNGQPGNEGARGVNLTFHVKIATFGGVLIDATGGDGGPGGSGGAGGKSGNARCSDRTKARNGEAGGNGGRGGNGGSGGFVDFHYKSASNGFDEMRDDTVLELALAGINLVSDGGLGGQSGMPGKGGAGGSGNSACIPKMGGGKRGSNGGRPDPGVNGSPGTVSIVKDDFVVPAKNRTEEPPAYY